MQTIVIASQKGGSGKTTLSGHLAVEAERAGAGPVALIDTDPQGSLAAWWNARTEQTPLFVKVSSMELSDSLQELHSAGIRLAIVDTPPAITIAITKVIASATLVIIPTRPSPHDLRAVGATVDIAEQAGKPLVFVLNDATPRARITGEAAVALSQHGTVAPVTLYHRVDYAASMVDGRTVGEVVPQSKSTGEVKQLWTYLSERLQKLGGYSDAAMSPPQRKPVPMRPSLVYDHEADPPFIDFEHENPPPPPEEEGVPEKREEEIPYLGPERRSGVERRNFRESMPTFGGVERRAGPFGRRRSDRIV